MFSGLSENLKKILPKRLFYRALLIVAVPVITLQLLITIVFFDSLWIKTNIGMTRALVGEIKLCIDSYNKEDVDKNFLENLRRKLIENDLSWKHDQRYVNVSGLEAALFLRNMDYITISQTIGRVIRKGNEKKQFGIVCVPVYDRVGISTAKSVNAVVDTIFNKGEAAVS